MSLPRQITITCLDCARDHKVTVWVSVNPAADPQLRTDLLNRDLNVLRCKCGCTAEIGVDLLYHDMKRGFMVWLKHPDERGVIELTGPALWVVDKIMPTYRRRIVRTRNELIEKILIFEADLDDRVIEVMKISLWAQLMGPDEPPEDQLFFRLFKKRRFRDDELVFVRVHDSGEEEPICTDYGSGYLPTKTKVGGTELMVRSESRGWELVGREFGFMIAEELLGPREVPQTESKAEPIDADGEIVSTRYEFLARQIERLLDDAVPSHFSMPDYASNRELGRKTYRTVERHALLYLLLVLGRRSEGGVEHGLRGLNFPQRVFKKASASELPEPLKRSVVTTLEELFLSGVVFHYLFTDYPTRQSVNPKNVERTFLEWIPSSLAAHTKMRKYSQSLKDLPELYFTLHWEARVGPQVATWGLGKRTEGKCASHLRNLFFAGAQFAMACDVDASARPR